MAAVAIEAGLAVAGVIASPILGPDGNREFPLHLRVGAAAVRCAEFPDQVDAAVAP